MEKLNRGIVAVSLGGAKVFVSWRWLGNEDNITFNLYRNGTKVNATPLTVCNYTDNAGSTTASYMVRAIVNGSEQLDSEAVTPWAQQYMTLPLNVPAGGTTPDGVSYTYSPNDCSIGDIDGDGIHEIFVKWDPSNSKDNSQKGYTGNVYIDCYTMKGAFLWRIDLGRNIRAGAHYTQFLVYDFDGDGMVEMACKTGDGTKDGKGVVIGNGSADYRNSSGYILSGPEYLTVFNGKTGAAMATVNYTPARGTVSSWGDSYGNRVDRFISAVVYLDGKTPSMVFGRGYYTRLVRSAWDWKGGKLTQRWIFDSDNNSSYRGQGNHQMTVGDVDGDGKQELCNGASMIDDNGAGFYPGGHGHGDALHMSDMDPDRPGLEVWQNNEEPANYGNYGLELKDAKTGVPIFGLGGGNQGDVGRSMAGDIDPRYKGYEMWGSTGPLYTCKGQILSTSRPWPNFAVYWDGDLQRELLDGSKVDKWDYTNFKTQRILTLSDAAWGTGTSCNTTKATPNISGDLFGDWREEIILHSSDNTKLLIYTTTTPSTYKFRTLLHDPQYRVAIAWQQSCYNQPPHLGYYLGEDMATPAKPNITIIGGTPPIVVKPIKIIYTYDNSGNYAWENANNWSTKTVPSAIDTVIIRTGEVRVGTFTHTGPVYVEANGILRLVDTTTINDLHLQGGTLKAYTSAPGMVLTSNIKVDAPSTIMAGSVAATIFTLNGTITGSSDITKTSVGNLRINSSATGFKGNWIIAEGKLQVRSATALGVCGVQVKAGARLDVEVATSIYSLKVDSLGGVDLDQPLTTDVSILGSENMLTGSYTNASRPSFIGSTSTLTVKNSILAASGSTSLCPGSTVQLNTAASTTYSWKNGTTQVGTAQAYTASAAGDYAVSLTNANGCKVTSAAKTVTKSAAPSATITSTTPTTICTGGSVGLTASAGASYKWYNGTTQVATTQTYTATTAGVYKVEVTNASGCKATSTNATVTVNPLPTATITTTTPTTICNGGSVVLTSSAGTSYKWFNGTTQVATTQAYTATTAGDYTVEVTNANGCKATSTKTTVIVNTAAIPTIAASGSTTLCTGESVVLTSSTGSSYKWFNGTTQVATTQSYTVTTAGDYTVEVTNANGCKATSAKTAVTLSSSPTGTNAASGPTTLCEGESVTLSFSSGASYKWYNGTTQIGTSQTYTATTAGNYSVEVTSANGCKVTSAATTVTVNALPTASITTTAPTTICAGTSILLTSSAGTSYKWFNGTTQVGASQTYIATTAGDYTVEVTNANGCKAISTKTTIVVSALPTATISSTTPTSICSGESVQLTSSVGSSYKWFNGSTQVATTQNYTATTAGDYTVEVTGAGNCKATSSAMTVSVSLLPAAIIATTTPIAICTGESVILTSSIGASYKWYNGTTLVGANQTYTATTAGSYTVEVTSANNCKATSTATTVSVSTTPAAIIATTTPTTICSGESVILTSSAGASYKWFNGTTQVGTSQTFAATADGDYTVEVTGAGGCKATSSIITVNVIVNIAPEITASTSTTLCDGESVLLTSSEGSSYKWFNGTTQVGVSQTYMAATSGDYVVEVTSPNGCKATSAITTVTLMGSPVADITALTPTSICIGESTTLMTELGSSYIWYNGDVQVGATQSFTVTETGEYTVEITNASGCKTTSEVVSITVSDCNQTATGISSGKGVMQLNVFPNPFVGDIEIQHQGSFSYQLYDSKGSLVVTGEATDKALIGNDLSKGLYLLQVGDGTSNRSMQIVKE